MRTSSLLVNVICLLLSSSIVAAVPQVDFELSEKFNNNSKVYVTIVLKHSFANNYTDNYLKYRMNVGLQQISNFILTVSNDDFEPVQKSIGLVPFVSGYLSKQGFEKLKVRPEILSIYIPGKAQLLLQDSVPLIMADRIRNIIINNANITGKHQTICIIDTGVNYSHSDLGGCFGSGCKVAGGYDFCSSVDATGNCISEDTNPMDDNGHGTRVAGIVAANGGIVGIAPNASIVALKVFANALGDEDSVTNAVQWCLVNRTSLNISVISISLGYNPPGSSNSSDCFSNRALSIAIKNATEAGIFVDVASGNDGNTTHISYPACVGNATSVGATTKNDAIASFSDRAKILDLVAPGADINTTNITGNYSRGNGTSASAPHVAGTVALMLQAANQSGISLTPSQIESIMKRTGKPVYDHVTGLTFQRIDAYRSVMSVLYGVFVSDLSVIHSNLTGRHIFEFSVFNNLNSSVNVTWNLTTGDGTVINGTQNITLSPFNETLVYAEHFYNTPGTYTANVSITSSQGSVRSQEITINVDKYNLRAKNLSILNSTGGKRIFEFWIENNSTLAISGVFWKLNATGESEVNSVIPITLAKNETAFVYVEYQYVNAGSHNVTAVADPTNIYIESNETDNTITITD